MTDLLLAIYESCEDGRIDTDTRDLMMAILNEATSPAEKLQRDIDDLEDDIQDDRARLDRTPDDKVDAIDKLTKAIKANKEKMFKLKEQLKKVEAQPLTESYIEVTKSIYDAELSNLIIVEERESLIAKLKQKHNDKLMLKEMKNILANAEEHKLAPYEIKQFEAEIAKLEAKYAK